MYVSGKRQPSREEFRGRVQGLGLGLALAERLFSKTWTVSNLEDMWAFEW
jgi:hypothetical protein